MKRRNVIRHLFVILALICTTTHATSNPSCHLSSSSGHIQEQIPEKYRGKYQRWKKEFLITETGRRQWEAIDNQPALTLIITISQDRASDAFAGEFRWDEAANLTNATITLGCNIDSCCPDPIYYPVLSSLKKLDPLDGPILAAAKMAHEFDHVNQAITGGTAYRNESEMSHIYSSVFLRNGYNANDPRLVALTEKMGRTPVEIGEDREHRAEIQALRYLLERVKEDEFRRKFLASLKKTISVFARSFQPKYVEFLGSQDRANTRPALAVKTNK